jgi:hypothetical protein
VEFKGASLGWWGVIGLGGLGRDIGLIKKREMFVRGFVGLVWVIVRFVQASGIKEEMDLEECEGLGDEKGSLEGDLCCIVGMRVLMGELSWVLLGVECWERRA